MIRIQYHTLFNLKLSASYYFGKEAFGELYLEPTMQCRSLLSKYHLLHKRSRNGLAVLYEADQPASTTPRYPINQVETFHFLLKVQDPAFWMYADVQGWKKETVYVLTNPSFNTTANVVISNVPLTAAIRSYPMSFRYDVVLQSAEGLVEVRNASGTLLRTVLVRSLDASEPAGTRQGILLDLGGYPEGVYQVRYVNLGGTTNENVFCSPDFSPDILAVVQMKYRTGAAWTGVNANQQYQVRIVNRKSDWFYDVHIRSANLMTIQANNLKIQHLPVSEPPIVFNVVPGSIPPTNDFVQFKSAVPVDHWQFPFRFKLTNTAGTKTYIDTLPLPSPVSLETNAGVLFTRVIVNV